MPYEKGDQILIYNIRNNHRFIGEISVKNKDSYILLIYIFPEDTKDGKQSYMSNFEVFLTGELIKYNLNDSQNVILEKVEVVSFDQYINRKYKNLDYNSEYALYFKRQDYSPSKNVFYPENLPRFCFCNEIFNPDIPFQISGCDHFYHINCLMQTLEKNCYAPYCEFNYQNNLSQTQKFEQSLILLDNIDSNISFENNIINTGNNNLSMEEFDMNPQNESPFSNVEPNPNNLVDSVEINPLNAGLSNGIYSSYDKEPIKNSYENFFNKIKILKIINVNSLIILIQN